ncbi:MAG: tripartite tricarboxylate transporter TctB family protein [Betaproteobacteria bacterium]|nr:tripartite tricarboxylate transporter TctB family protein [Betaproteobacteria bacterium]
MGRSNPRQKSAELVVAALFFLAGAIVVYDSVRLGARWAEDGPQAGYFPFYVGLLVCVSALVNFVIALLNRKNPEREFVQLDKLKLVLAVLVPAMIYVALISWIGIYVASVIFIAFFMRWLGKYAWWKVAVVSVGVMVAFFLIFEVWFLVPLPKGPVENLLGVG